MADVELVIKMPEEMYKWVNDVNKFFDDYGTSDFIDLVKNGTPLPKGHGRIADIDKILEEMRVTRTYDIPFALERVKPIIEADKESEDKEKLSWLGKNCKDCGNEKCKKLGTLPKGYDCALWQPKSERIK